MEKTDSHQRGWHVANWTGLGWLETAIKAVAILIGLFALVKSISVGRFALPSGLRVVQLIVMAVLALGLVAAIFDRFKDREIIAMIIVIFNNLAHWGMVLLLLAYVNISPMPSRQITGIDGSLGISLYTPNTFEEGTGQILIYFCVLLLLGDIVKIVFIKTTNFKVRNVSNAVLYGLTSFSIVGYAAILILELIKYKDTHL